MSNLSPELTAALVAFIGTMTTFIAATRGAMRIELHVEIGIRRNGSTHNPRGSQDD